MAAATRPGGALLLCNVPDEPTRFSHPAVAELVEPSVVMATRFGAVGLECRLAADLEARASPT